MGYITSVVLSQHNLKRVIPLLRDSVCLVVNNAFVSLHIS